jgi:predicted transcriptional regulator
MEKHGSTVSSVGRPLMTSSPVLLLSIKPVFAAAIYAGNKIYEFRRAVPRRAIPGPALIYETMPVGRVTGWTHITEAIPMVPNEAGELANPQDPFAGGYVYYLTGARSPCALALGFVSRFSAPITLSALSPRPLRPPRSFCYLDRKWLSGRLPPEFYHSSVVHSATGPNGSSDAR